MMELVLKNFDYKKHLKEQRILFKESFPEVNNSTDEEYYWRMHSIPGGDKNSYEYAAYIENKMVGYYAAIPLKYKILDKTTEAGMVCGVMTSPDYRGKGVFTKLGAYSTSELSMHVDFTTGFPIRKAVIPGHIKVGWEIAFKLPLYMKFIKTDALLKNKLPKLSFLAPIFNFTLYLYHLTIKTKISKRFRTQIFNNIDEIKGYNEFIAEWIKTVPNVLIKDRNFARWRYGGPQKHYKFIVISNEDKMIGFAAYCSVLKESVPSYCLLDLCVLPDNFECLGLFYKTLYQEANKNNIEAIMVMLSRYSAKKYKLIKNAFLRSPYTFYLIIKNLTHRFNDEQLLKEKNWHLMWVDSDDL